MREITNIVIHCSATPEGRDVKTSTIRHWHVNERGWSDIGYHYVIELDGKIVNGRPEDRSGAHVKGHNSDSIGICYVGGVDVNMKSKDTRNDLQKESMQLLLKVLKLKYPKALILGHRDFSSKDCPSFDAKSEYSYL